MPDVAFAPFWRPGHGRGRAAGLLGACLAAVAVTANAQPVVTNTFPRAGGVARALGQFEVSFNGPVQGVQAADLLVNNTPATNLLVRPGGSLSFQFAQPVPGTVTIRWAANAGITDYAATPGVFAGTNLWTLTLNTNLAYPDLVLTEICAGNRTGLADENGLAADWIEIHNRGLASASLGDWSLSDDPAEPGQWVFPARTLAPGARLVVFASAKDIKAPAGTNAFHTRFTLDAGGGFLGLYAPESPRALRSGLAYPDQRNDYSWGPDATGQPRYFAVPTPGAANPPSALTNLARPVHFSVSRGFFAQPFDLVLSTPTPGATIRYTTNGAEPTAATGLVYAGPLRVTNSAVLRAAAFAPDAAPSTVATHTYLFNQSAAIRSLPVLSLVTSSNHLTGSNGVIGISVNNYVGGVWTPLSTNDYNNNLKFGLAWERPVSAEWIEPRDNSGFQADCGLRVNGSDYTRPRYTPTSKFSYRLYFRSDYGPGKLDYPLFPGTGRRQFDCVILRAGHNDITNPFTKDELNRRLHGDTGQPAAQGTFVNLFINGVYKGYYNPTERVDEESLEAWNAGGADWDRITVGSAVQEGDNAAWTQLRNFCAAPQDAGVPATYQQAVQQLDAVNFIDYLLVQIYAGNWDWPANNWRAARERVPGSRWRFYAWDLEGTYSPGQRPPTVDMWTTSNRVNLGTSNYEIPNLQRWLTNSPEYRLLFADRIQRHFFNGGALTDASITNRFLDMRSVLAGVIASMDTYVITTWVPQRRAPLFSQFLQYGLYASNAPVFSRHGGTVAAGFPLAVSAPHGGTIYYTTNGSDPRVPFTGAVSPDARAYAGPVTLPGSVTVKARTLNAGTWSPLTEAEFAVATLGVPIRVSEIHYNPPGGSAHEFLELVNAGPAILDLGGFFFSQGISFLFPAGTTLAPGATLLLANNLDPASFATRYPGVGVFGWFSGSLNNAGERLALSDAAGQVILTVDYSDQGGWPTAADGGGASLEILNPLGSPDDPANWRASDTPGGTPGQVSPPPAAPVVRLNEVMAGDPGLFTDWLELANTGPAAVDLSGWSITDNGDPRRFVFPAGVILPAGGHLVVRCDTNTTAPGWHTGFALDQDGDLLLLFNAQTQRVDAVSFGPQVPGHSLGRVGAQWVLCQPTTNAANVAASVGAPSDVVINEWLANAPPGQPDWLELHNRGPLPVALRGCYLATSNAAQPIAGPVFIAGGGYLRLWADEGIGFNHLDFKLTAAGDTLSLHDPLAAQVDQVTFATQAEGISRGRWPNGSLTFTNFVGTASPGASNYVVNWTGPVFSEILARGAGTVSGEFLELHNPGPTAFDLGGHSVSADQPRAGRWVFPPGTLLPAGGFAVIACTTNQPASVTPGAFNLGEALDADSGGAHLFNPAGQLVHSLAYGPQVAGKSIGLSAGQWRLLATPTPGAANAAPQALGTNSALRLNEWMAEPLTGPDWFELFNTNTLPVDLAGLFVSDDPSTVGLTQFRLAPLSFIGATQWVRLVADNNPAQGLHHVSFSLDGEGEGLWLSASNATGLALLDTVSWGLQAPDASQGRFPDGAAAFATFAGSATPGSANKVGGPPQFILVPPNDVFVRTGSNAALSVVVMGADPMSYQWRFNGALLAGETNASLLRTNFQPADEGFYQVTVSNPLGQISTGTTLRLAVPLAVLQSPLSQTLAPGQPFTLSATITGQPPPFSYEWRISTTAFTTNVSGNAQDFITLIAPAVPTQQLYRVVVRNAAFPVGTASSLAVITVVADSDGDGLPDAWEAANGFPTNNPANGLLDTDGDGLTDYEEYVAGTQPTNAASTLQVVAAPVAGGTGLDFAAVSNRTYTLQSAPSPTGAWTAQSNFVARSSNSTQRIVLPPAGARSFFRVVTPAQP
ncbi:MAG: hypothetical protein RJA22_122 [Verrucomicrobiota bacterium]